MLKIKNDFNQIEMEFNGIKIIQVSNTTKLIRNIFDCLSLEINGERIKNENIILINDLTKFNDLVKLNKNSKIYKLIFEKIERLPIINEENINKISEEINNEYFSILEVNDGDLNKTILNFFDILNLGYLDKNKVLFLLSKYFVENKFTFIFQDIDWINVYDLLPYVNFHNYIIVTNNFRKNIKNINDLELLYICDENFNGIDVIDKYSLINFIEKELNIVIDAELFLSFIENSSNLELERIFFLIQNLKNL